MKYLHYIFSTVALKRVRNFSNFPQLHCRELETSKSFHTCIMEDQNFYIFPQSSSNEALGYYSAFGYFVILIKSRCLKLRLHKREIWNRRSWRHNFMLLVSTFLMQVSLHCLWLGTNLLNKISAEIYPPLILNTLIGKKI